MMGTLAALALATPVFGFALTPPPAAIASAQATPGVLASPAIVGQLDASLEVDGEADLEADTTAEGGVPASDDDYVAQVRRRAKLAKVHRSLGIATWVAMTATVAAGTVQFRNLYGAWDDLGSTPCVTGDAWPTQSPCSGTPAAHLATSIITTGLYGATMGLAYRMPDPDDAAEGDSKFAKRLRAHKILRWVHLSGMIAQMIMGPLFANPHLIGLDRTNDYKALRGLASFHLAVGYVTWGSLTAAGSLMLF